jgi:hypothetical protein
MVPGTVIGLYLVVDDIASAREELLGRASPSATLAPVGGGLTYAKSATPTATHLCFNRWLVNRRRVLDPLRRPGA